MELNERLLVEITNIFRKVQYGQITFKLSPDKLTLDYTVETTGKIVIEERLKKPRLYYFFAVTGLFPPVICLVSSGEENHRVTGSPWRVFTFRWT